MANALAKVFLEQIPLDPFLSKLLRKADKCRLNYLYEDEL